MLGRTRLLASSLLSFAILATPVAARDIADMGGRTVTVPTTVTRIYGSSPADQMLIYAIDPKLVAGQVATFPTKVKWLDADYLKTPVITPFFSGALANVESVVALKPDAVLIWDTALATQGNEQYKPVLDGAKIPTVVIRHDTYDDIIEGFKVVGALAGKEARAQQLVDWATAARRDMEANATKLTPAEKVLKVYYVEDDTGFMSRCSDSPQVAAIKMVGATVVPTCKQGNAFISAQTNLEELIGYDPDVIITISANFLNTTIKSPQWQQLKAVKNNRVYLIPNTPFNWYTRPPGFMQVLGLKWLGSVIYPDRYAGTITKDVQDFFKLFLGQQVTEPDAKDFLAGK